MVPGGNVVEDDVGRTGAENEVEVDADGVGIAVADGISGVVIDDGIRTDEVGRGRGVAEAGVGSEIVRLSEVNHAEAAAESEVEMDRVVVEYIVEEKTSVAPRTTL